MNSIRVLVGTRKGAFVLTADEGRKRLRMQGPHFAGWEIYHLKARPPIRIGSTRPKAVVDSVR